MSHSSSLLFRNLNIEQRSGDIFPRHKAVVLSCSTRNFLANVKKVRGKKERVLGENKNELDICRIHVEEYHEPVFALSSRLFCHL